MQTSKHQQGVVLVVALIMMAVIAISSAAAIKSVMTQDRIGSNQRVQSIAAQQAESMLRYCEAALLANTPNGSQQTLRARLQNNTPQQRSWTLIANWAPGGSVAFSAPADFDGSGYSGTRRPQCIVERTDIVEGNLGRTGSDSPSSQTIIMVTARGFSPDYAETANGTLTSGASAWLQSTVQVIGY